MKILIASNIDPATVIRLEQQHDVITAYGAEVDVLTDLVADRDVMIFRSGVSIAPDVLKNGPDLKLLIRAGSGLDNIDIELVERLGIRMVRIPRPSAQAVAEFTLAMILDVSRNLSYADRLLRKGHWPKPQLAGSLIAGKTLGIVGVGNIGSRLAELTLPLGMKVFGCVNPAHRARTEMLESIGIEVATLPDLLKRSDIVSLHTPLTDETRGLIGAEQLAMMPPSSILISTARGGVVDEAALADALDSGQIRAAALDVHQTEGEGMISPLASYDQVLLTPHIAAMAMESQQQIGDRIMEFLEAWERNELDTVTVPIEQVA